MLPPPLRSWPESEVPDYPEGWLLTVARNRLRDLLSSAARRTSMPIDEADELPAPVLDVDAVLEQAEGIPFAVPSRADMPARLPAVLEAIRRVAG